MIGFCRKIELVDMLLVVVVEVMLEVRVVEEDVVAELDVVVDYVGGEEVV